MPPLNFLKSLLENVKSKKVIPVTQACHQRLQGMEHTHKLQSFTQAPATKSGRNSNFPLWPSHKQWESREFLSAEQPGLCRETKAFHFSAAKRDFHVLETLGFRQNCLKLETQNAREKTLRSLNLYGHFKFYWQEVTEMKRKDGNVAANSHWTTDGTQERVRVVCKSPW